MGSLVGEQAILERSAALVIRVENVYQQGLFPFTLKQGGEAVSSPVI